MTKILKYKLLADKGISPVPHIKTPPNSTILSVAMLPEGLHAWAMVPNPTLACSEIHHLGIINTGLELPDWIGDARFIATIQYTTLKKLTQGLPAVKVEHVFELDHGQAKAIAIIS